MDSKKPMSLTDVKAAIKAALGTPQNNQNAATALAGQTFLAENAKGEVVLGTILGELSIKGKVQAELSCSVEDCEEMHIREQSDWHQSLRCRTHAQATKAKLTDEEKMARKLARAKADVEKYTKQLS